ncbi:MAG: sugar phosphate isomerase/epimerase [Lentisphaeria bacterium]|nr:sugar phosphate isomerase/epimerase [Lentisphaeria bacterium]
MKLKNTEFGIITNFYGLQISIEEAVLRLSNLGIRNLEVPGWHWSAGQDTSSYIMTDHPERLNRFRSLLRDQGMNVQQFHSHFAFAAESEESRTRQVERNRRTIDLAAGMGAKAVVIHIGGTHAACGQIPDSAIFEANARSLSEVADHAKNTSVKIAIENLMTDTNRMGCRISELKDLITAVGSDRVGICLDTGHANVDGLDVPEAVRECGNLLIATHIQETCRGNDLHMFPFALRRRKSTMDWFRIFDVFAEIGYPYPLIGECANAELPLELADRYLEAQKNLIESILRGEFER